MADTEKKVVVGSGKKRRFSLNRINKTKLVMILLVLVIIAGGALAAIFITREKTTDDAEEQRTMPTAAERDFTYFEQVNGLIGTKQYDQALKLLDFQNPNDSHEVLALKATVYLSKGDYQAAMTTYESIQQKHGSLRASEAVNAGRAAEALGQFQKALGFYEEAVKSEKATAGPENPLGESRIAEYQGYADKVKNQL